MSSYQILLWGKMNQFIDVFLEDKQLEDLLFEGNELFNNNADEGLKRLRKLTTKSLGISLGPSQKSKKKFW